MKAILHGRCAHSETGLTFCYVPRQSGLLSSPEEEQFVATQQRRSKACGSQTARGDTMHALSESRRDMAKAKTSVQVRRRTLAWAS